MPKSRRCTECGKTVRQHQRHRNNKRQWGPSALSGIRRVAREETLGNKRPDPPMDPRSEQEPSPDKEIP